jgi:hypothetical protein
MSLRSSMTNLVAVDCTNFDFRPSARGGLLISNLLSHVLSRHDFSGPSKTYSIPPDRHGATKALDEAAQFDHDGVVVRDT